MKSLVLFLLIAVGRSRFIFPLGNCVPCQDVDNISLFLLCSMYDAVKDNPSWMRLVQVQTKLWFWVLKSQHWNSEVDVYTFFFFLKLDSYNLIMAVDGIPINCILGSWMRWTSKGPFQSRLIYDFMTWFFLESPFSTNACNSE